MKYIYSLSENPFELSSFEGDRDTALSAGYKEITDEEYESLVKHKLKWDNGELVENHDNTRDDGTEIGIIIGSYIFPRTKKFVDTFCNKGVKLLAVERDDIKGRDYTNVKFVINANEEIYKYIKAQNSNIKFFNDWKAAYSCDDKWLTYVLLKDAGVPQPLTSLNSEDISYPKVIKTRFGSYGYGVHLAHDIVEETSITNNFRQGALIFQEYIESSKGKDICAYVINNECVACMIRENTSQDEFRSHTIYGATATAYNLTKAQKTQAIQVAQTLGVNFCSINFLIDSDGTLKVCDVNSNPGVDVIESATGVNVIDTYANYIIRAIK